VPATFNCNVAWPLAIEGIAYDEYIIEGNTTPPSDNFGGYCMTNSAIRVRGSVTGNYYEFSASRAIQPVDARDATSLLNTRFFRRA
jgi:hypothetical protein